ncbi:MAG: DUF2723 domain-containing protein [Caldilineaceae bacterium]
MPADRRVALLVVAFALGWYARTLAPGLLLGDPGEFQFAAWRFGLAHPTGYPLYLVLGGIWQHLLALFGVDPAFALNLLSTILGALTAGLLYLLMTRLLPTGSWGRLSALFAALLFTLNPTFWSQNIIAEVYALNALLVVAVLWAALGTAGDRRRMMDDERQVSGDINHPLTLSPRRLVTLSFLFGLAIGHHRTAFFLVPGLLLWLFWQERSWWRRGTLWLTGIFGVLAPQILYLYIPLRSGPDASPWFYPRLNGDVVNIYGQGIGGFVDFITGRVFAVSFLGVDGAAARLPQMAELWLLHFNYSGLALVVIGLIALIRGRRWAVLLLTAPFALLLQIFNLFYGIGDIYVFYIPLYLVAAIWAAFGVYQLGQLIPQPVAEASTAEDPPQSAIRNSQLFFQFILFAALLYFVIFPLTQFYDDVDLSANNVARVMWDAVLAADPPADAILVSNDRNEIVPLYYLQTVEGRAPSLTGIFPLLTPEDRFADVGETVQTALDAGDRPVYLIKPMDGLEVRFDMMPTNGPLVQVLGAVDTPTTSRVDETSYGPLTLCSVTLQRVDGETELRLFWRVDAPLTHDFTTTVQLFDADGNKIGQSDQPPGLPYYPTALWKEGDSLRERHRVSLPDGVEPAQILVAMYRRPPATDSTNPEWVYLAEPLMLEVR